MVDILDRIFWNWTIRNTFHQTKYMISDRNDDWQYMSDRYHKVNRNCMRSDEANEIDRSFFRTKEEVLYLRMNRKDE